MFLVHSELGRDMFLKISNTNRILIFQTPKALQFMFYVQFCPKLSLPSMIFFKKPLKNTTKKCRIKPQKRSLTIAIIMALDKTEYKA